MIHRARLHDGTEIRTVSLSNVLSGAGILVSLLAASIAWGWAQYSTPFARARELGEAAGLAAAQAVRDELSRRIDAEVRRAEDIHSTIDERLDMHEAAITDLDRWRLRHVESGGHVSR
jgi:hypothetical protein